MEQAPPSPSTVVVAPEPALDAGRDSNANIEGHDISGSDNNTQGYQQSTRDEGSALNNSSAVAYEYDQQQRDTDPYEEGYDAQYNMIGDHHHVARPTKQKEKKSSTRKRGRSSSSSSSDSSSDSSPSPERKRRNKNKKRRRRSSSNSSTSSSSSPHKKQKRRRKSKKAKKSKHFTIKSKRDQNKWGIKKAMADHINSHALKFICDKDIQEQILDVHPVPNNVLDTPKLDPVIRSKLEHSNKDITVKKENSLCRAQKKIRDTLGPLSRVWSLIEEFKDSKAEKKFMDVKAVGEALEQANILLGQAQVAVLYIRRLNVLSTLAGHKEAKQMLKDNSDLLAEENSDNELFGDDFRKPLG